MCGVILHINPRTGCICILSERGEFYIATLRADSPVQAGDLLRLGGGLSGTGEIFNITRNALLRMDVHYRTHSEVCARKLLKTLMT